MPNVARICWLTVQLASALLLLAGPARVAAGPDTDPRVASGRSFARKPRSLPRRGLRVCSAPSATVRGGDRRRRPHRADRLPDHRGGGGQASRAEIIGFNTESGLGLLRAVEPLAVKPMPIGTTKGLSERTPMIVAGHGGCCYLPPDLRRLLGIPAGRRDLHRATLSRMERRRVDRFRRRAR